MGVIPALIAKSSICYDPVIYVGMNSQVIMFIIYNIYYNLLYFCIFFQFRASFRRILGIGSDDLAIEKGIQNTIISKSNEEDLNLQYLNPKNNSIVSVTIYREEDNITDNMELERRLKKCLKTKKITLEKT